MAAAPSLLGVGVLGWSSWSHISPPPPFPFPRSDRLWWSFQLPPDPLLSVFGLYLMTFGSFGLLLGGRWAAALAGFHPLLFPSPVFYCWVSLVILA